MPNAHASTAAVHFPQRAALGRLLLACMLVALSAGGGVLGAAELSSEARGQVDATIDAFLKEYRVPGLSAAIVVDGQLVYEHGYGLADIENQVPATPLTMYRLASISKMFTATAAMQLAEQGKLDLAAPIQKYVPSFPEKQGTITAELLLKHQSGIRHYRGDEVRSVVFYNRVGDSLGIFQDDALLFAPGEKFSYTTYGYNLLGTAIEGASGEEYVAYVQKHILEPCGIESMRADNPNLIIPHRAAGYRLHGTGASAELRNDFMVDVTNKIPGGGWCGPPGDLARFAIALMDGRLVETATLERMWTPQATTTGKQTDCGLGCFISDSDGQRRISHSGGQPKVSTFLVFCPEEKTAVALMCNLRDTNLKSLANQLMDQVAQPVGATP
ncbi:MAG: serine hydrolase domain-containing protein [Pirellulales bacterium]